MNILSIIFVLKLQKDIIHPSNSALHKDLTDLLIPYVSTRIEHKIPS